MNLNQVTVPSLDLSVSIPFYQALGLQLIVKSLPGYARFVCPEGGSTLSLHHVDSLSRGEGVVIYFESTRLDQKVAELKSKGIAFDLDPTDQSWLWRDARLQDPDGNRLHPPWRISE